MRCLLRIRIAESEGAERKTCTLRAPRMSQCTFQPRLPLGALLHKLPAKVRSCGAARMRVVTKPRTTTTFCTRAMTMLMPPVPRQRPVAGSLPGSAAPLSETRRICRRLHHQARYVQSGSMAFLPAEAGPAAEPAPAATAHRSLSPASRAVSAHALAGAAAPARRSLVRHCFSFVRTPAPSAPAGRTRPNAPVEANLPSYLLLQACGDTPQPGTNAGVRRDRLI